ncbi:MAG: GNAT family N-acetyltransferase [Promethearchaeota archaeon]
MKDNARHELGEQIDIRQFARDVDEPDWVEVLNAAYKEFEVWWRDTTVDEMLLEEKRPNYDFEGRFIASINEKPVGIVHAHVDKLRKEKKGFIHTLCVVPKYRGRGIEEKLLELAISELKKRGMKSVQSWSDHQRSDRIQLLEANNFETVRTESDMEMDLGIIPSNIGENLDVNITPLQKNVEEDIEMFNWLYNESFQDHFNYRALTIEEARHYLTENPRYKEQEFFFAEMNQEMVGFVGLGIDEEYNIEKNIKVGFVNVMGVLKPFRRKGIGTRLMLHILEMAKAKGMTKALLDVDDFNLTEAKKLYEKIGFNVVKKYLFYERSL